MSATGAGTVVIGAYIPGLVTQQRHPFYGQRSNGQRFQNVASGNGHARLQISFLRLIEQVIGRAPCQRHNRERGIFVGVGDETGAVGDK